MICADLVTLPGGGVAYAPTSPQPVEFTACQAVLLAGEDVPSFTFFAVLPPAGDLGQAWAISFGMVVTWWAIGQCVGYVLRMIR